MYGKEVTSGPKDLTGKIQTRSERLIRNGVEPTAIHTGCPGSGHLIDPEMHPRSPTWTCEVRHLRPGRKDGLKGLDQ
jgi:hypothetical protein